MKKLTKELIVTAVPTIILSLLIQNESYGWEIIQKLKVFTSGEIDWEAAQAAQIYNILKDLETKELIKSYWKVNDGTKPRKYYSIQKEGIKQLEENGREWETTNEKIIKLWHQDK